ncbi:CD1247 N-terminal domain-containing protein, partial [Treponema sp. R6D11]
MFFGNNEIESLKKKIAGAFSDDKQKEVLTELVGIIEEIGNAFEEYEEQIQEIDDDLNSIEEFVYADGNRK